MIPLWLKIAYTLFVAVLVPVYWRAYTPLNFLWFCDVALLVTLVALWTEDPLLAGMPAVAIVLPQILWVIDFIILLIRGQSPIGLSGYMRDESIALHVRGLSLFHGWLPFLLLWLVYRLGYDRRALLAQTVLCAAVLILSYLLAPYPVPADRNGPGNVNKIYGLDDSQPQTWMAPWLWVGVLMLAYPILVYLPTHLAFCWLFPPPAPEATDAG